MDTSDTCSLAADWLASQREGGTIPLEAFCARHGVRDFAEVRRVVEKIKRSEQAMVDPPPPPPPPVEIARRYWLKHLLATGAFATVYLADDSVLRRQVAIKLIHRCRAACQEAQKIAALATHSEGGIVEVYDAGTEGDWTYIVFPYMKGTLEDWLSRHPKRSPRRVARLLLGLIRALAGVHAKGFIHRDVKPANILCDPAGRPHLADFGLAIHVSEVPTDPSPRAGTRAYMAPERLHGTGYDHRSDFYSLGVVAYWLLWGPPSPDGEGGSIRPPADRRVPADLRAICEKCLQPDPADRYTTAADMAGDLRRYLDKRASRERSLQWVMRLSLVATLVLGGSGLLLVPGCNAARTPRTVANRSGSPDDPIEDRSPPREAQGSGPEEPVTQPVRRSPSGAAPRQPAAQMIGLSDGQTVSGIITFGPNLERHRRIRKAGYYIRKVGYDTSDQQFGKVYKSPFYWGGRTGDGAQKFDTRTLANGTYRLSGYITTEAGDDLEFEALTFTVAN